ncbi:methylated-DNA--[protein]-cysteine S-methyltransferase [Salinibius halmophilus]|uniref:methylated-DNA--[protein]-cysteine S-methyltransferase n=1 Tax=Salinibius halmophilus TaxID=1853216 RepID=UPI000E674E49|nr:methylated-DNA--[protein]-cysteine S-methyltransferase [Salinibius halmophilus]
MQTIQIQYHKTRLAEFVLGSLNNELCLCDFRYRKLRAQVDERIKRVANAEFVEQDTPLLAATRTQLDEYLLGKRREFDLPLKLLGSAFQQQVWQALLDVPYGSTTSYQAIGEAIGNAKAVRAIGTANGANAIAIIVPCHRVIGRDGSLTGYGGGLALKQKLLNLEQSQFFLAP